MYRNMVTSLLDHERIETTDAKAKSVRRLAERMITLQPGNRLGHDLKNHIETMLGRPEDR